MHIVNRLLPAPLSFSDESLNNAITLEWLEKIEVRVAPVNEANKAFSVNRVSLNL
jgi:hypothetical protein